jgi:hypothetical protein
VTVIEDLRRQLPGIVTRQFDEHGITGIVVDCDH